MGPPRRKLQETVEETLTPPPTLEESQLIARLIGAAGKNLYHVELPSATKILVELDAKFRSTIWMKRGNYVVVDTTTLADRDNKIDGEIINIVRDEKRWRKAAYWPAEFVRRPANVDEDDDDSVVGKLPPSDSEED